VITNKQINFLSKNPQIKENFKTLLCAIEDLKKGRPIILTDHQDRENEGDFVIASEFCTADMINLMATEGRGLICITLEQELANHLSLSPMVQSNSSNHQTAFTISIDHVETATGISTFDRALTIQKMLDPSSKPQDFLRPGHIFPLIAKAGGAIERPGHTEASVDLMKMADLKPTAVICEILDRDGKMAKDKALNKLAEDLNITILNIEEIISFRKLFEDWIVLDETVHLPTSKGDFDLFSYVNKFNRDEYHLAIKLRNPNNQVRPLVRIHSECLTGDVFGSLRCDCGEQLDHSLKMIKERGNGVVIYLKQEGRGIGLLNKIKSYKLQENGLDTYEANIALGLPADSREYDFSHQILKHLNISSFDLITNNPDKIKFFKREFLSYDVDQVFHESTIQGHNSQYLKTKKEKFHHSINLDK